MARTIIGELPLDALLVLVIGTDRRFDVRWKADGVPVQLAGAVVSQIRDRPGGAVLLDVGAHATIDADGATVHVLIPAADTADLDPFMGAIWSLVVSTAGGEVRELFRGEARALVRVSA